MVAYSFKSMFAAPIQRGDKRQTIRAHRRRHAHTGETLQLFTGMRTRHCTKIIDDPVCMAVCDINIDLRNVADWPVPQHNGLLLRFLDAVPVSIDGERLGCEERAALAARDGFADQWLINATGEHLHPYLAMMKFWMEEHGPILFEGVLIRWEQVP